MLDCVFHFNCITPWLMIADLKGIQRCLLLFPPTQICIMRGRATRHWPLPRRRPAPRPPPAPPAIPPSARRPAALPFRWPATWPPPRRTITPTRTPTRTRIRWPIRTPIAITTWATMWGHLRCPRRWRRTTTWPIPIRCRTTTPPTTRPWPAWAWRVCEQFPADWAWSVGCRRQLPAVLFPRCAPFADWSWAPRSGTPTSSPNWTGSTSWVRDSRGPVCRPPTCLLLHVPRRRTPFAPVTTAGRWVFLRS